MSYWNQRVYQKNKFLEGKPGIKTFLFEYTTSNLIAVTSFIFTVLGAGIIAFYYAGIKYMPSFSFQDSLTFIIASGVTSLILLLFSIVLFILPGAMWGISMKNSSALGNYLYAPKTVFDWKKKIIWFVVPFTLIFLLLVFEGEVKFNQLGVIVGLAVALTLILYYMMFIEFYADTGNEEQSPNTGIWRFVFPQTILFLGITFFSSGLIFFPLLVLTGISMEHLKMGEDSTMTFLAFIAGVCYLLLGNVLAIDPPKKNQWYWLLGLGLFVYAGVLVASKQGLKIPDYVMNLYKFGNIPNARLVLKKDACKTLGKLDFLSESDVKKAMSENICALTGVKILSRLGESYYLELDKTVGEKVEKIKFTISSENVLSWSTLEEVAHKQSDVQSISKK